MEGYSTRVLTLCTSKGGTGKSTLVRNLAAHWLGTGARVAVIDADPQASVARWRSPQNPHLRVFPHPEETVGGLVEELRGSCELLLIDTGGFRNRTTAQALLHSSDALIPLRPSADDVAAALETYRLIQELNRTPERASASIRSCLILSLCQRGTVLARHVRAELESQGFLLLRAELPLRVAYPEAALAGSSPCLTEPNGAAARAIARIAAELGEVLWNEA
jgi:chromosome partitioning protein